MKILELVKRIIEEHDLKPIELPDRFKNIYDYLKAFPEKADEYKSPMSDWVLINKYEMNIPLKKS